MPSPFQLGAALPVRSRAGAWYLFTPPGPSPAMGVMEDVLHRLSSEGPPTAGLLQDSGLRKAWRNSPADDGSLFIKLSRPRVWKKSWEVRLRRPDRVYGHRGLLGEVAHGLAAQRAGLPVPAVLGYAERRGVSGRVLEQVLFQEAVEDAQSLERLAASLSPEAWAGAIDQSLALMQASWQSGVVHMDFHAGNVLLANGPDDAAWMIDWDYACSGVASSPRVLAYLLGYFCAVSRAHGLPEAVYDERAAALLRAQPDGGSVHEDYDRFKANIASRGERFTFIHGLGHSAS